MIRRSYKEIQRDLEIMYDKSHKFEEEYSKALKIYKKNRKAKGAQEAYDKAWAIFNNYQKRYRALIREEMYGKEI